MIGLCGVAIGWPPGGHKGARLRVYDASSGPLVPCGVRHAPFLMRRYDAVAHALILFIHLRAWGCWALATMKAT